MYEAVKENHAMDLCIFDALPELQPQRCTVVRFSFFLAQLHLTALYNFVYLRLVLKWFEIAKHIYDTRFMIDKWFCNINRFFQLWSKLLIWSKVVPFYSSWGFLVSFIMHRYSNYFQWVLFCHFLSASSRWVEGVSLWLFCTALRFLTNGSPFTSVENDQFHC